MLLKILVAILGDMGGYHWLASASTTLSGKEGGLVASIRVTDKAFVNGGGSSLLLGEGQWEDAGDSTEGSLELSVDMT